MASNYRKSFNFKNGVQVDTDNFVVDPVGKVGIGTTVPRQFLDVYGNDSGAVQVQGQVKVSGLTTTATLYAGIGTIGNLTGTISSIGIGTFDQLRVGNSPLVDNLVGYAYTAWITNVNENGFSNLGLRTDTSVGIGSTTLADFNLVIGSDPRIEGEDGIGFKNGNIRATGIITAPTFNGNLIGTVTTAAQPNITSVGTLTELDVTGITSSSAFANFDYLQAPFNSSVTFTVTVASKDSSHRYNGTGSEDGYLINGVQAPFLTLTPGRNYTFTNDNTGSHPLKFYLEADRTTEYTSGVLFADSFTSITVDDETPTVLHYQCVNHEYMGNAIQVNSNVVNTNYDATLRGGLDVDGHTELDNVNASGISTIVDLRLTDLIQESTGIATFVNIDGSYGNFDKLDVGIGTAQEFTVKDDDSNTTLRVNNDTTSIISIGKSEPQGNQSAQIKYNDSDTTLQIANYDIGGIDVLLHEGTSGIDTGGFRVKYDNVILTNTTYDGRFSINRDTPEEGFRLDVRGISRLEGAEVVGILTITNGSGNEYELNPENPPQLQGNNFNIATGISTLNDLRVIGTITPQNIDLNDFGNLDLGWSPYNNAIVGIGSTVLSIGYREEDGQETDPNYEVYFNRSNISIGGSVSCDSIEASGGSIIIDDTYSAVGAADTHFSGNIDNTINERFTLLGITTVRNSFVVGEPDNTLFNGNFGESVRLGVTTAMISNPNAGVVNDVLFIAEGTYIGIGTTNAGEFHTPGYKAVVKRCNTLIDKETVVTATGKLQLRNPEFESDKATEGKIASERGEADPRGATGNRPGTSPFFGYGKNLDIDTTTTTMIFDGSVSFVPAPGQAAGSGASIWDDGIEPDFTGRQNDPNTGDSNNSRLTMVGINTYIPRCLLDLGVSSPSMNSYMILPTLDQTSINIVQGLWHDDNSGNQGHDNAQRLTPSGVPKGAILYNSTTDTVQIRDTANSFRTLGSPKVEQGHITTKQTHGTSESTTELFAEITLRSSSSKVMINVTQTFSCDDSIGEIILKRTIGGVGGVTTLLYTTNHGSDAGGKTSGTASISYLDTPGNAGLVRYETFGHLVVGTSFTSNSGWNGSTLPDVRSSHITLMEIE